MAISPILIGRCYCRLPAFLRGEIRKQPAQRHQCTKISNRMRWPAHRLARRGIEHPDWDLLRVGNTVVDKATARHCAGRSLNYLMDADHPPSPRMPGIGHRNIAKRYDTVQFAVESITRAATPRSDIFHRWTLMTVSETAADPDARQPAALLAAA
jgi:hypothetical protein